MLMEKKNSYCQKGHTIQSNLQIQSNAYQNTNGIFHSPTTNNPKICMEP